MTPPSSIEALPNGQWVVAGDTHLGAWAKQHGQIITDPHLFKWLKPHLNGVRVVWDAGANIGDHTRQYLDWGMHVVAIEPHPVAVQCLSHNCPEADTYNLAASYKKGSLNFTASDNVGASRIHPDGEWSVPAMALDDIPGLPAPDFIKIDIEGFEAAAITGMAGTLTRHRPILLVEMNKGALAANDVTVEGLREQIESLGYRAAALYPPEAKWDWEQFDCLFLAAP